LFLLDYFVLVCRFYQKHDKATCDSDGCYRFFQDFDTTLCHYDTCWQQLAYPVTAAYQGYETISHTRAFTLVFIIFIIAYAAVSKPWR
jgi:hypothetical protein